MSEEKLLTVREVAIFLGISERQVVDLAESGKIPAYKVGGVYLRFKKDQVAEFKKSSGALLSKKAPEAGPSSEDRISDFLYFNDFYIFSLVVIAFLVFIISQGY
ncbi:MAG TPA: helix-turn-helix domain-containing protein [Candidatus Margulisiibacteriota bacterium]|nr:helix-turn-helix domain-containing protein [Candidatus Margulisiibacteriota bacterium]